MVPAAVLRHPARHPRQAGRRARHVRLDRPPVRAALARYQPRALLPVPAGLQVVHGRAGDRHARAGLLRRPSARGRLRAGGASRHCLLLLPLPGSAAGPGQDRAAVAVATQHRRCGAQEEGGLSAMRKIVVSGAIALAALAAGAVAIAAESEPELKEQHWHFKGPFGTYDRASAQRGFQVYKEVCSACHSLNQLYYRNLTELGLTEDQVKGIAAEVQVPDLGDDGQPIERPARPSDHFNKPFPNELAAAAANNGKAPPHLSPIIKARVGHEDYVYSLLTGYGPYDQRTPEQLKECPVVKDG